MTIKQRAVLRAHPLTNAKRQYCGMRVVIDNRSVDDHELHRTLAMLTAADAATTHPMILAFDDERLPATLQGWCPPINTFPEFHGEWLSLPAAREMLSDGNCPQWCLNGTPGAGLDPALTASLAYVVASNIAARSSDSSSMPRKPLIRTGARTMVEASALFTSGADWIAGWPAQAIVAREKSRRTESTAIVLRLLQLAQTNADISELEAVLKLDAGLSFKLLRFINSAANGLSLQVQSFQHAVMILGYNRLARWLALLVLTANDDPNLRPIMGISLRRAFFIQRIGKLVFDDADENELFITGLFSLLDAIFAQPFDTLLEKLHLPEAVSDSLRNHSEPYGSLLHIAQTIEGDDSAMIRDGASVVGLKEDDVNRALLLAIKDANAVAID